MSTAARSMPFHAADTPFEIPDKVRRLRDELDWDAYLPARARHASWARAQRVKRALDIIIASASLLLLSPLMLVVAVLVKLSSPGPVFYPWRVLGQRARPFVGYKFRTMVVDADALKAQLAAENEMQGPAFKLRNDPRITTVGRWLRKYSIDELPQLWSVLKGDMSMVGPRPPSAEEFAAFEPWQWAKLSVIPGITCLWQVSGRSDIRDFATWCKLDLEYISRWNLWLDLRILLRTIPAVIRARGAY